MLTCQCTTKEGKACTKKCSKKPYHDKRYCWQHQTCNIKKRKKNNILKYNALIGTGTYGCVFKPPLKCRYQKDFDTTYSGDIMKLMRENVMALDEEEVSRVVRKADPHSNYFLPLVGNKCLIDTEKEVDEIKKCNRYDRDTDKSLYRGFFIKYGGVTLYDYIYNNPNKALININNMWNIMHHLIKGLNLLQKLGIMHLDIKINNIVVDNNNVPKFIDFGFATFVDSFEYVNAKKGVYYQIYPLFYSVLQANSIKQLYDTYEQNLIDVDAYFKQPFVKNSHTDFVKIYYDKAGFTNAKNFEYFNAVVKPNLFKMDINSLFDMFYQYIIKNTNVDFGYQNMDLYLRIFRLIMYCIHPNVDEQYDMNRILLYIKNSQMH